MVMFRSGYVLGISELAALLDDNPAELAARLAKPIQLRSGAEVILFDDFEAPIGGRWFNSTLGAGTLNTSVATSYSGAASMAIYTPGGAGNAAGAVRGIGLLPDLSKIGMQFVMTYDGFPSEFDFGMSVNTPSLNSQFDIFCALTPGSPTGTVNLRVAAGAMQAIGEMNLFWVGTNIHIWLPFKLVVDPRTGQYSSLTIGDTEYEVANFVGTTGAAVVLPHTATFSFRLNRITGMAGWAYVDDLIVTQNES